VTSDGSFNRLAARFKKTMAKKRKKRTAEEIAHQREWQIQSDANLQRLRELVHRGWAELQVRRRGEAGQTTSS
jgi:Xaa-Pro aminopeptidase